MNYPIWMIAWRKVKRAEDILEKEELIKNEKEAENFSKRYYNRIIKTRELTNEERINHGFASLRSDLDNPKIESANNITPTKPPKKSWLEIAAWITGIAASLIAIYEFIIKKFLL